eukprot:Gb_06365 [translate_table: standard]
MQTSPDKSTGKSPSRPPRRVDEKRMSMHGPCQTHNMPPCLEPMSIRRSGGIFNFELSQHPPLRTCPCPIELFENCAEYGSHLSVFNGSSLRIRGLQLLVGDEDCLKGMLNNVRGNLVWLRWYNCPYKNILPDLAELVITSSGVEYLPQGVAEMRNLEYLNVSVCPLRKEPFTDLEYPKLESMFRLHKLDLSLTKLSKPLNGCSALKRIAGLRGLGKLRRLDISNCEMLEELPSLEEVVSLEEPRASWCFKLKTIRGLQQLVKLLKVDVRECRDLEELLGFEHLASLEELHADGCWKLKTVRGLNRLKRLNKLQISLDNSSICNDMQYLLGLPNKLCTLILTARTDPGKESEVGSIPNSFPFLINAVNFSLERCNEGDYMRLCLPDGMEPNSCTSIITCFVVKACAKGDFLVYYSDSKFTTFYRVKIVRGGMDTY